jgi:hypothetical protein
VTQREQGKGLTRGEGCCGSDEANRRWMGALNVLAGEPSRARRLAIDSNSLELMLIYFWRQIVSSTVLESDGAQRGPVGVRLQPWKAKPSPPCGQEKRSSSNSRFWSKVSPH